MSNGLKATYRNVTEADLRYYHAWRAATTGLLQDRLAEDSEQPQVARICSDLKWLMRCSSSAKNLIEPELREILNLAVHLDAEMKKQRAHYYFQALEVAALRGALTYDNLYMQTADGPLTGADRIAFLLSPALVKRGTASGDGYSGGLVVLVRAIVLGYPYAPPALANHDAQQRYESRQESLPGLSRERSHSRRSSMDQGREHGSGRPGSALTRPKPVTKQRSWFG
jgi:hypothetical protein